MSMESEFQKKSTKKTKQTAASHHNSAVALEDNRAASIIQKKKNNTGLPDNLKAGIENLSGHSLDDVKVHYNSSKPAQLNAHAYAQGTNIHLASGQEKHLAHETWHIVQQKQGRVQPTKTINGARINDNASLEKEADVMGAKALQCKVDSNKTIQNKAAKRDHSSKNTIQKVHKGVIQFAEPQDKLKVIQKYFPDTYAHYGASLIRQVCVAKELRVHAHGSGSPGDGINAATQGEMDDLLPHLRAAKRAAARARRAQAPKKKSKAKNKSKRHNAEQMLASANAKKKDKANKKAAKHAKWLASQRQ